MMDTKETASTLGRQVRRYRLRQAWTQDELATRAGISRSTLLKIEAGDHQPHPPTIRKLARALAVDPVQLTTE
ncbi:MAG TPA: helix-turn-helix transcriptional regulator [Gemmatimonadales bacterium]|nr:helix-turn-helix transcriptional regulator [Gemmatimonadales bacterium]